MQDTRSPVFFISNAHLDPVWLWEWEEGLGAALATFRSAAKLCEEFDGFVFNHNEALLYEWVESFEPALFARIQRLVAEGRWHIMGGWFLQPDCNLPSGESIARQIERGRRYFDAKFGVRPTTAINFDPFGHSRGLAQLLARSGYDSYLICRPAPEFCELPGNELVWEGFDGSRILLRRVPELYNSPLGKARETVEARLVEAAPDETAVVLWGLGNHGGGPSRQDIRDLDAFARESTAWAPVHATPEAYFARLRERSDELHVWRDDINRWAVGCYTSQARVKQEHRALESELFAVEKLASAAAINGLTHYPFAEFADAERDLLVTQFHDILPGTSTEPVEAAALRQIGHGREILSRIRARGFHALASGQAAAREDAYPILAYNPHPFPIQTEIDCELQLVDQNWSDAFTAFRVFDASSGAECPCQLEKEASNMPLDWRKRLVFRARLEPMRMNRFDAIPQMLPSRPSVHADPEDGCFRMINDTLDAAICARTGRLTRYRVGGADLLGDGGAGLEVVKDDEDSWAGTVTAFGEVDGTFEAMDPAEAARFAGLREHGALASVRAIEDGAVRRVVEALLRCGDSAACLRYTLPRHGSRIRIDVRVDWRGKDRALKFAVPLGFEIVSYQGQTAYGSQDLPSDGAEAAFQQWCAAESGRGARLALLNNGFHGGDLRGNRMRATLLRSPGYSAHHIDDRRILPEDRFNPRIDQGERSFTFWLDGSSADAASEPVDTQALYLNEPPVALTFFPSGEGAPPKRAIALDSERVALTAFRRMEENGAWMIRLFNPGDSEERVELDLLEGEARWRLAVPARAVLTWRLSGPPWDLRETDLLGDPAPARAPEPAAPDR